MSGKKRRLKERKSKIRDKKVERCNKLGRNEEKPGKAGLLSDKYEKHENSDLKQNLKSEYKKYLPLKPAIKISSIMKELAAKREEEMNLARLKNIVRKIKIISPTLKISKLKSSLNLIKNLNKTENDFACYDDIVQYNSCFELQINKIKGESKTLNMSYDKMYNVDKFEVDFNTDDNYGTPKIEKIRVERNSLTLDNELKEKDTEIVSYNKDIDLDYQSNNSCELDYGSPNTDNSKRNKSIFFRSNEAKYNGNASNKSKSIYTYNEDLELNFD